MLTSEEIDKRMNILKAKIVHEYDKRHRTSDELLEPMAYMMMVDTMLGKMSKDGYIVTDPKHNSHESYEELLLMCFLYLSMYEQLNERQKEFMDMLGTESICSGAPSNNPPSAQPPSPNP
jgi:hypothetical protein